MLISILRKFGVGLGHSKNRYSGSDFIMGTLPTVFFFIFIISSGMHCVVNVLEWYSQHAILVRKRDRYFKSYILSFCLFYFSGHCTVFFLDLSLPTICWKCL